MEIKEFDLSKLRTNRIFNKQPFFHSKHFALKHGCDLAIPNARAIGNIICFSRLIEEYSLHLGRPIRILTAPLQPASGKVNGDSDYPIWEINPHISDIVNADEIDPIIMEKVNIEKDNYCQFNHIIENMCATYGLKPRKLKPSLFLSPVEMSWALKTVSQLKRPVICIHPSGTTSSTSDSPWYLDNWKKLIDFFSDSTSFIQIGISTDFKNLPSRNIETTLRQTMSIIWASDLFIGFDSCQAHIATAFDKPALVLWDVVRKSQIEELKQEGFSGGLILRWAYPQNRNLLILGEKNHEIFNLCIEYVTDTVRSFYCQDKFFSLPIAQKWVRYFS